jgi:hypothetical protein
MNISRWNRSSSRLSPYFEQAKVGAIATAVQIKQAFETQVRQEVAETTIYRLLARHGWRKLVPRPVHPKADEDGASHV